MPPETACDSHERSSHPTALNEARQWRAEKQKGDEAVSANDFASADVFYKDALARARRLFIRATAEQFPAPQAVHILTVSRHSLADNFMRQGMSDEAYTHYYSALSTLCDWLEAPNASEPMRRACADQLARAMHRIVSYLEQTGADPQQISAIRARVARHNESPAHPATSVKAFQ